MSFGCKTPKYQEFKTTGFWVKYLILIVLFFSVAWKKFNFSTCVFIFAMGVLGQSFTFLAFCFVSIALGRWKFKIFQNFGFFWKWHTLMGKEWSKVLETQYFWVMVPQKNFGHFWRHWPAHFFTTRWMRSFSYLN